MTTVLLIIIAVLLLVIAAMAMLIPAYLSRINSHLLSLRIKARRLKSIEKKLTVLVDKIDNLENNNGDCQPDMEKEISTKTQP